jgi:hypothetical protein
MSKATALKGLRLSELSLVDEPANEDARVTVTKRSATAPAGVGPARKGAHSSTEENSMSEKETALQAQVTDLTKSVSDLTTKLQSTTASLEKAQADLALAQGEIAKGKDETILVGGVELKKSAVGEGTFAALKAQASEIAKAKDEAETVALTKRAETEFANLPGEPLAKARVLKAVAGLPEAERTTLEALLKAGNAALKSATTEVGKGGGAGGDADAEAKLETLAKSHAAENKVSIVKARAEVLETPEGKALYRQVLGQA